MRQPAEIRALTEQVLEQAIRITHAAMIRDFGIRAPRLAVAGLNPHAGEGGTIGQQEILRIAPLLDRLRAGRDHAAAAATSEA